MRPRPTCLWLLLLACPTALRAEPALPAAATHRVDFVKEVQPVLAAVCHACHGEKKQKGGLRLDLKAAALRSGAIVPGSGADSPLLQRVAGLGPEAKMPPKGPALTPKQVAVLRAWIDQGAHWPEATDGASGRWSLRPLARPPVPAVKRTEWVRSPLDAFVLAKLEARGMAPAPPADRRTLIRRVTFDLIGLPPTPEEIDAFLNDPSPRAFEKVVDRLLASPHYGERWARHWMDVAHFAETHGNDQDAPRDNAWPYRDYLVRSFNADKPYARFVREQLAGDVLFPGEADGVIATGFLAAGPWDESSQKDIRDDTLDKKVAQTLDRDDMVTTAMSAFVSATVHCARCHDHKFDPISQKDYYALQAVFAGVDRANRAYEPDPLTGRTRAALLKRKAALHSADALRSPELLSAAAQAEVATWEKGQVGRHTAWTVLTPASVGTAKGSKSERLPDGSVRFSGPQPPVDTYTVEAHTALKGITAVRLEVLTDDSLPHKGPGRESNGNLHLSEFRVHGAPKGDPSGKRLLALQNASADFNQAGWTVAMSIDGNPKTAWGIYPEVGKPHAAAFELKEPAGFDGGTVLTFTLEQLHGGHLIGRLRLSVTTALRPVTVSTLPDAVVQALAVPSVRRAPEQKAALALHVLRAKVERELAALPPQRLVYAAAPDFQTLGNFKPARGCRPVHVLRRGDVKSPLDAAAPGALSCVSGLPARFPLAKANDEGARRAALARWVTDPNNVLAWRSIANRVWHYHFGRGIVATPNDLGVMGARPTHPELLDWLAVECRDGGGSLKALHRLIVTSATYRQSSRHNADYARTDAGNLLLWRMNRTRLDAESVRDAVLAVSGKLDRAMGGPSVKHFLQSPGIHVTPNVDYLGFDLDGPGAYRRSVYRFLFRTLPDPFMDALDCPDASQFAPVRSTSVTALQALALLNDRFMVRQSEHFAARVGRAGPDLGKQVGAAFLLALGRPPSDAERAALTAHARKHGMANVCRLLLNTNEFMFLN